MGDLSKMIIEVNEIVKEVKELGKDIKVIAHNMVDILALVHDICSYLKMNENID